MPVLAELVGSMVFVPKDIVVERCAIDGQLASQVGSSANSLKVLSTIIKHEGASGFFRAFLPHQYVFIPFVRALFASRLLALPRRR